MTWPLFLRERSSSVDMCRPDVIERGGQFAGHPLPLLLPNLPPRYPYRSKYEFLQLFLCLCQGHFLLLILADFFQVQVKASALKGNMSTFPPLVAPHIVATANNTCLSGEPQAANMLRQAEQKTLLCAGGWSFWHALWPASNNGFPRKIYLPSKLCSHKCSEIQTRTRSWLNCLFSLVHESIHKGQDTPDVSKWEQIYHSLFSQLLSIRQWSLNPREHFHGDNEETRSQVAENDQIICFRHSFCVSTLFPRAPS